MNNSQIAIEKTNLTPNTRKSPTRQRIKVDKDWVWIPVRGNKKFFVYTFERFSDIYVYITYGVIFPIKDRDGFTKNDLKKVFNTKEEILVYLNTIQQEKNKKIMFSCYSIILKLDNYE